MSRPVRAAEWIDEVVRLLCSCDLCPACLSGELFVTAFVRGNLSEVHLCTSSAYCVSLRMKQRLLNAPVCDHPSLKLHISTVFSSIILLSSITLSTRQMDGGDAVMQRGGGDG